jgi:hypothetical protein
MGRVPNVGVIAYGGAFGLPHVQTIARASILLLEYGAHYRNKGRCLLGESRLEEVSHWPSKASNSKRTRW